MELSISLTTEQVRELLALTIRQAQEIRTLKEEVEQLVTESEQLCARADLDRNVLEYAIEKGIGKEIIKHVFDDWDFSERNEGIKKDPHSRAFDEICKWLFCIRGVDVTEIPEIRNWLKKHSSFDFNKEDLGTW